MDRIFDIASLIVMVGLATTLVAHKNTSEDINAVGSAFSKSLSTAMGK